MNHKINNNAANYNSLLLSKCVKIVSFFVVMSSSRFLPIKVFRTEIKFFFYLIYFEIRYLTAIIFDVTRIQYRQIIQILVQSD